MCTKEVNEQLRFTYDSEQIGANKEPASCCRGCAYEVRCERDTSWRGRCPDYTEYASNY